MINNTLNNKLMSKDEKYTRDIEDTLEDNAANRRLRDETQRSHRRYRTSLWLVLGVGLAIILLLIWLTIADLWGDTDVAVDFIAPLL